MLQIKNISKKYITGDLVQTALDGVSLNLRDNEFVAILGPSGSGKTTLLNIIGGLDRYDNGDLIINNISTKKYKDRDWDSYRNHTIGFVFQSYNLIPHQSVLANVELALTISGISKKERKERAIKALEEVGLGAQIHKKPNQMSGGQMQRVAIARALVNNPDIVLADEPTGALDSDTSIQVMELLKQVAKDRLVVMVTHNPELAEEYATRIVRLKDGKIIDDTDPLIITESLPQATHSNMGKSSMSLMTSLSLSFNNLLTKKARTILTAFAGSIGIIGIALILSLSNGVELYIQNIEEETLSEYPIQITKSAVDLTSLLTSMTDSHTSDEDTIQNEVQEINIMSSLLSQTRSNDLKALKENIEDNYETLDQYINAIEYSYTVTPYIYRLDEDDSYEQVNPSSLLSGMMGNSNSTYSSYMTVFNSLPESKSLYMDSYEVLAGHWPENDYELVLVLGSSHTVTDFTLYSTGLKDSNDLMSMMQSLMNGQNTTIDDSTGVYNYNDFLGIQFHLVDAADLYEYDQEYNVYVDKSSNTNYMVDTIQNSPTLKIVGVVIASDSASTSLLRTGINYPYGLTKKVIKNAQNSEIVQKQLDDPEINVFTGTEFTEANNELDLSSLFNINTSALEGMFNINPSNMNMSNLTMDMSQLDLSSLNNLGNMDLSAILSNIDIQMNPEGIRNVLTELVSGYSNYISQDPSTNYQELGSSLRSYLQSQEAQDTIRTILQEAISSIEFEMPSTDTLLSDLIAGYTSYIVENELDDPNLTVTYFTQYLQTEQAQAILNQYTASINEQLSNITLDQEIAAKLLNAIYEGYDNYAIENNLPQLSKLTTSMNDYLSSEEGKAILSNGISQVINLDEIQQQLANSMGSMMNSYSTVIQNLMNSVANQISNYMMSYVSQLQNGMNIDASSLENLFSFNMDSEDLTELLSSMSTTETASYTTNLSKLNYAELDNPDGINIYPKNFDCKAEVISYLDDYNDRLLDEGKEDQVITFTDYVGVLMGSVTKIIDTISYLLIAFVSISLVVSSIMIGIITYISVLERTKEIGILRAIGASKSNVSGIFNAETFLIGLLSGLLGIGITELLLIPANIIIRNVTGNATFYAALPILGAIVLIIVSVVLTLLGGWIPSKAAAKKDPVLALRSE